MKAIYSFKIRSRYLGVLTVLLNEDFEKCEIEGYGKAYINYARKSLDGMIINSLNVSTHSKCAEKIANDLKRFECDFEIALNEKEVESGKEYGYTRTGIKKYYKDAGLGMLYDEGDFFISEFCFDIPEDEKKTIEKLYISQYQEFEKKVLDGEVKITLKKVGCDFEHLVFNFDYDNINRFSFCYYFEEKYGLRNYLSTCSNLDMIPEEQQIEGNDVTVFVLNSIHNRKDSVSEAKKEAKETGKPTLILSYCCPEELTPLANDGEDDMVTCSLYAMPDGTLKKEYSHNY